MFTNVYYLLRSRQDGSYLVAHPRQAGASGTSGISGISGESETTTVPADAGYLIVFQAHADGLSYLNHHAPDVASRFAVESMTQTQLKGLMQRWNYSGIGLVSDPLLPKIQFMS